MSCSGCRVLRKGCSDDCTLRHALQYIDDSQAQANATVFVAKFFGRAGLMTSVTSVPESQRPALFQSLLFEAVGRTVNPVSGAVGLLWKGNWHLCQAAVETVLRGGKLKSLTDSIGSGYVNEGSEHGLNCCRSKPVIGSKRTRYDIMERCESSELDLGMNGCSPAKRRRDATPPLEVSETTTLGRCSSVDECRIERGEKQLLRLFV